MIGSLFLNNPITGVGAKNNEMSNKKSETIINFRKTINFNKKKCNQIYITWLTCKYLHSHNSNTEQRLNKAII